MANANPFPFGGRVKVSVIIPTLDRCKLLQRAIASVRAQTYTNWEIIVVDDGSRDGSAQAMAELSEPRLVFVENGWRRGAGFSRHRGVDIATGEFVAFLDSDDYWAPEKLQRQLSVAERLGEDRLVIFAKPAFDHRGRTFPSFQPPPTVGVRVTDYVYAHSGILQTSSFLISGPLAREVRFDPTLKVNQDTDYLIRLEHAGAAFAYVDEALFYISNDSEDNRISSSPDLIEYSLSWFRERSRDWSSAARRGYLIHDQAMRCARAGLRLRALRFYVRGFSLSPGPYQLAKYLVLILCSGRVPQTLRWAGTVRRTARPFLSRLSLSAPPSHTNDSTPFQRSS